MKTEAFKSHRLFWKASECLFLAIAALTCFSNPSEAAYTTQFNNMGNSTQIGSSEMCANGHAWHNADCGNITFTDGSQYLTKMSVTAFTSTGTCLIPNAGMEISDVTSTYKFSDTIGNITLTTTPTVYNFTFSGSNRIYLNDLQQVTGIILNGNTWNNGGETPANCGSAGGTARFYGYASDTYGGTNLRATNYTSGDIGVVLYSGTSSVCGNGLVEDPETCDDGNLAAGDGCSATCTEENGWTCAGEPSICSPALCGDNYCVGTENWCNCFADCNTTSCETTKPNDTNIVLRGHWPTTTATFTPYFISQLRSYGWSATTDQVSFDIEGRSDGVQQFYISDRVGGIVGNDITGLYNTSVTPSYATTDGATTVQWRCSVHYDSVACGEHVTDWSAWQTITFADTSTDEIPPAGSFCDSALWGWICGMGRYLFIPTNSQLQSLMADFKDDLSGTFPFDLMTDSQTQLANIYGGGTEYSLTATPTIGGHVETLQIGAALSEAAHDNSKWTNLYTYFEALAWVYFSVYIVGRIKHWIEHTWL